MLHLLDWKDWQTSVLHYLLGLSHKIKRSPQDYTQAMKHKNLLMLFEKTSTRTRTSFEVAMNQMGGDAIFMDPEHSQISKTKLRYETASISGYCDFILARLKSHESLLEMSQVSEVSVINGCCDRYHPCQTLADIMTISEYKKNLDEVKLVYTGIYNNVANSLVSLANHFKIKLTLVCPADDGEIIDKEQRELALKNNILTETENLSEAVATADFVYTDTWLDMEFFSDPKKQDLWEKRKNTMLKYQLNRSLLKNSKAWIMHDMPIHAGYEIEAELVESENSIIYQQSKNRLYAQKAILCYLLETKN